MKIKIDSLDNIHVAAKEFLDNMGDGKVFAFYGKMGAGKTTFVKAICEELGVEDVITSPTFAIVNEYTAGNGDPIYHFDFYRIKKLDEVYDMGYEDYFYSGNLCFLEWPELIEDLLPEDCTKVHTPRDAVTVPSWRKLRGIQKVTSDFFTFHVFTVSRKCNKKASDQRQHISNQMPSFILFSSFYKRAWNFSVKVAFDAAPTNLSTSWPPLKKRIVGILRTPNSMAISSFSSTSHLPTTILPSNSSANSDTIGAI